MFEATGLEVLEQDECLRLLGETSVGRVVFTEQALPAIRLVRYAVHDGSVILRTSLDSKLASSDNGVVVAFEADRFDVEAQQGWSVTFVGKTEPITEPSELDEVATLDVPGWAEDSRHFVRIRIELIEGRRLPDSAMQ